MASATASHVFAHAAGQSARRTQRAPSARPLAPVRPSPFGQLRTGRAELAVARVFGGEGGRRAAPAPVAAAAAARALLRALSPLLPPPRADNREKKALTRETEPEE